MNNNQQKTASTEQQKDTASGGALPQKQMDKSKMTEAMKKIDAGRDQRVDGFGITDKFIAEDFSSTVYFYESVRGPVAIGFAGRAKKAAFHSGFKSDERRAEYVAEWMQRQHERVERRKPEPRGLKVGDVLVSSWGYEQTNIDYYLVTKLVGSQSVELVEIGREIVPTGDMTGTCVPDKSKIIGEPMRKKVDGVSVKLSSFASAHKKEPSLVAGCEVYSVDRYSSYH